MSYRKFTADVLNDFKLKGYKYIVAGPSLTNEDVGLEDDTTIGLFEVIPAFEEPPKDTASFNDINSSVVNQMAAGKFDEVYYWVKE